MVSSHPDNAPCVCVKEAGPERRALISSVPSSWCLSPQAKGIITAECESPVRMGLLPKSDPVSSRPLSHEAFLQLSQTFLISNIFLISSNISQESPSMDFKSAVIGGLALLWTINVQEFVYACTIRRYSLCV